MPLDPSVPGLALLGAGRQQPFDPLETIGKLQEMDLRKAYADRYRSLAEQEQQQQAKQQQIDAIIQAHPRDFDTAADLITQVDPEYGQKFSKALNETRYSGARAANEMAQGAKAKLEQGLAYAQMAITNPANYPAVYPKISQLAPDLVPMLPRVDAPPEEITGRLTSLLPAAMTSKDYFTELQKASEKVTERTTQPELVKLFTGLYAASPNEATWKQTQKYALGAGLQPLVQQMGEFSPEAYQHAQLQHQMLGGKGEAGGSKLREEWATIPGVGVRRVLFDPETGKSTFQGQDVSDKITRPPSVAQGTGTGTGAAGGGGLDEGGIQYAATMLRITGQMPPLGMGKNPDRAKIINAAAEQARLLGQSPVVSVQKQAAFKADKAALTRMTTMASGAQAFEQKALAQTDIIRSLSDKVDRTFSPKLNSFLQYGKKELLGDDNSILLANAIQTFSAEYAKIITGSTNSAQGSTDSARREAEKLLSDSFSKGTTRKVLALMQQEMELTMEGYQFTIDHITKQMGGAVPDTNAPTDPKIQSLRQKYQY